MPLKEICLKTSSLLFVIRFGRYEPMSPSPTTQSWASSAGSKRFRHANRRSASLGVDNRADITRPDTCRGPRAPGRRAERQHLIDQLAAMVAVVDDQRRLTAVHTDHLEL